MNSAFSIRYPRGQGVLPNWRTPMEEIKIERNIIKEEDVLGLLRAFGRSTTLKTFSFGEYYYVTPDIEKVFVVIIFI